MHILSVDIVYTLPPNDCIQSYFQEAAKSNATLLNSLEPKSNRQQHKE